MITLITYADASMSISADKLAESAQDKGIEQAWIYGPHSLGQDFKMMAGDILQHKRGAGYWVWKPYIILRHMDTLQEGQILMYSDAGILINHHMEYILSEMDQDVFLFGNTHKHQAWCKFKALEISNMSTYSTEQVQASVILLRVNDFTRRFIREWMVYCLVPGMIDDSLDEIVDVDRFGVLDLNEHRHDQAILTEIALKYEIRLHYWSTQYSRFCPDQFQDKYPGSMFIHHRKRNEEYI